MTNSLHPERNHGLDTLRALAIVLVVLHHYVLFVAVRDTFGWVGRIGWVGVDLFFALSGYLIGNQIFVALRSGQPFSLGRFYARRFLRTLPNYYVVLALYALWPWFRAGLEMPPLWRFLTFTLNINQMPGTAFSHAWSLCIEEQFYVLLPAAALAIAALRTSLRWAWGAIALVILAGIAIRYQMWSAHVAPADSNGSDYFRYIYYSTLCRFDELVAGVALALLKNYHAAAWQWLTARANLALAGGAAVLALAFWMFLDDRMGMIVTLIGFPMLAAGFGLLIVAALGRGSLLGRARIPGAASLALWSYAIYLVHKQLCILAREPLRALGYPPESLPAIGAMLALSVVGGWLLYRCVETPFMVLRQRYVPGNLKPLRN
ncbi:MAG TPA: acyltransferase [Telluria sp.]|jgi:peptidoglycan/LPS O-acetylase OafA/YrhL